MITPMNQKALIAILIVLVVGLGVAFAMTRSAEPAVAPTTEDSAQDAGAAGGTRPADGEQGPDAYAWQFSEKDGDVPSTQVTLVYAGASYDLGAWDGTCSEQDTDYLPGQVSKAVCWYAGGGVEFGVFEEGGKVVVKRGTLDEGSAEEAGFRGDFRTVLAL